MACVPLSTQFQVPNLLNLPRDVLRLIFNENDPVSRIVARFVCSKLRELIPYTPLAGKPKLSVLAAEKGYLSLLKWAWSKGCPMDKWVCAGAARGGHLEVLRWAHANRCPWDVWTCQAAAYEGHLEVLRWAIAKGCPGGEKYRDRLVQQGS